MVNLILYKEGKEIFSSDKKGLRPIVEAYSKKVTPDMVYDKVIGLAAAIIMTELNSLRDVKTDLISKKALRHLQKHNINTEYKTLTEKILNHDKTGQCPMEHTAETLSKEEFLKHIRKIFLSD